MKQHLKTIVLCIILFCAGSYITHCSGKTTIEKFNKQLVEMQNYARTAQLWADSVNLESQARVQFVTDSANVELKKLEDSISHRNVQLEQSRRNISRLRTVVDSQQAVIASDSSCVGICQSALELVDRAQEEADSANARAELALQQYRDAADQTQLVQLKFDAMTHFAMLQVQRGDSLDKVVTQFRNLPTVSDPDKLFGFIKLPSRTISYLLGVATGIGITSVTISAVN